MFEGALKGDLGGFSLNFWQGFVKQNSSGLGFVLGFVIVSFQSFYVDLGILVMCGCLLVVFNTVVCPMCCEFFVFCYIVWFEMV